MVHGAFCGGWCFDDFRRPFEAAGLRVLTPDLRGHDGAGALAVAGVSIRDYAQEIVDLIDSLDRPPVLVGHSMGGLVCQIASARRPVAGLVVIAPSPPWGQPITSGVEMASAVGLYVRGAYWLQPIEPDYPIVRRLTFDRLPSSEARRLFQRMVPESGRALFEIVNWWLDPTMAAFVPPLSIRAPALALTGGMDQVHPVQTVQATARRLNAELKIFPEMSHWTIGEPGWPQVADAALSWMAERGL